MFIVYLIFVLERLIYCLNQLSPIEISYDSSTAHLSSIKSYCCRERKRGFLMVRFAWG